MNPPLNELPQFLHCAQCRRILPKTDLRNGRARSSPDGGFLCMHCLEMPRRDLKPSDTAEMHAPGNGAIAPDSELEPGSHRHAAVAIGCYAISYPPMLYLLRGLSSLEWGLWESAVAASTMLCLLGSILASIRGHRSMHPFLLVGMIVLCVLNLGLVVLAVMGLSPF